MASFQEEDGDILVHCPIDASHTIAKRKVQRHIIECQKRFCSQLEVCQYNSSHRVKKGQMGTHLLTCRDAQRTLRDELDKLKIQDTSEECRPLPVLSREPDAPGEVTDPWAEEGKNDGVQSFVISALNQNLSLEEILNSLDPDKPIDGMLLQRLEPHQKNMLYEKHRQLVADKQLKKKKEQEDLLERQKDLRPRNPLALSGIGRGTRITCNCDGDLLPETERRVKK